MSKALILMDIQRFNRNRRFKHVIVLQAVGKRRATWLGCQMVPPCLVRQVFAVWIGELHRMPD